MEMKVLMLIDADLRGAPLLAGQMAIMSDADGAALIAADAASALTEDQHGVFAVPMPETT